MEFDDLGIPVLPAVAKNNFAQIPNPIKGLGADKKLPGVNTPGLGKEDETFKWGGQGGAFDIGAKVAGAGAGLANAYLGFKGLGLAEDQFDFEKRLAAANYMNQAKLANTSIQNAADVGLALGSGAMTPEQIAASKAKTEASKLRTTL